MNLTFWKIKITVAVDMFTLVAIDQMFLRWISGISFNLSMSRAFFFLPIQAHFRDEIFAQTAPPASLPAPVPNPKNCFLGHASLVFLGSSPWVRGCYIHCSTLFFGQIWLLLTSCTFDCASNSCSARNKVPFFDRCLGQQCLLALQLYSHWHLPYQ